MTIRHRRAAKGLGLVLAGSMLLAACGASGSTDDDAKAPKGSSTPSREEASCLADAAGSGGGTPSAVTEDPIPKDVEDQTGTITVSGKALPALENSDGSDDPAVCRTAPKVTGTTFSGEKLTIGQKGRPYVVLFVAHWCPHCQREVPKLAPWLKDGNLPDGVDWYTVATATKESYPNYPPSNWLRGEGWPTQVIADSPSYEAAQAYGLSAYPFFVLVGADGKVVERFSGEIEMSDLKDEIDQALT